MPPAPAAGGAPAGWPPPTPCCLACSEAEELQQPGSQRQREAADADGTSRHQPDGPAPVWVRSETAGWGGSRGDTRQRLSNTC